jgi:hypothetical protein
LSQKVSSGLKGLPRYRKLKRFLLDYFHTDKTLIAAWKGCSESDRNRQFSALKVRTTLDERDGFTEKKRMEHYQLLCRLGAHASFQGFELLRPISGGDAHCGPYFADRALDATLSELDLNSVFCRSNASTGESRISKC